MKSFKEYLQEHDDSCRVDEGMFDKLFQKAMEKLAILIGPERMATLEKILSRWKGKDVDKRTLKNELEASFKTFKLDPAAAKEIQSECVDEDEESVDESIVDLLICANYGFWTAIMVKAALGLGIPIVLGIIRAAIKASASAKRKKNPFAKAKHDLDQLNKQLR